MSNVTPLPVIESSRTDAGKQLLDDARKLARAPWAEGFFLVVFDKEAGHEVAFRLGDGVLGPTLFPSWLAEVARRYSTTVAAFNDFHENKE